MEKKKELTAGGIRFSNFKRKAAPYVFVAPFFISFLAFGAFPIVYSLYLSLQKWNGIGSMIFIGLDNYWFIFSDQLFWKSLGNTLIMLLWTALPQHFIGLMFAFILNQGLVKFKEFFKGVLFVPYITSSVAIALIFSIFYGTRYGFFNYLINLVHPILPSFLQFSIPIEWLMGSATWFTLSSLTTWRWTGWNAIIYLAGLQAIPSSLYEAARIDGASWIQVFFRITIPLMRPVIYFATTMTIIGGMQLFDEPMIMIGIDNNHMAQNSNMGMTAAVYLYSYAFSWSKFGVACAAAYIIFLFILIFTLINRFTNEEKK